MTKSIVEAEFLKNMLAKANDFLRGGGQISLVGRGKRIDVEIRRGGEREEGSGASLEEALSQALTLALQRPYVEAAKKQEQRGCADMDDAEFLRYIDLHSDSELGLVANCDVRRLCALAGIDFDEGDRRAFISLARPGAVDDLLKRARERLPHTESAHAAV